MQDICIKYFWMTSQCCRYQACEKTCYQRNVIEQCQCSDAYYPSSNASAFNNVIVPVCSASNITQGARRNAVSFSHVIDCFLVTKAILQHNLFCVISAFLLCFGSRCDGLCAFLAILYKQSIDGLYSIIQLQ